MDTIESLIERYSKNREEYLRLDSEFSETDVRGDFLDPFLNLLGWDVENRSGKNNRDREVVRESRVNIDESIKKPDYEFRFKTEKKFYLEAKKPCVKIEIDSKPAFQCRRYGWSGKTAISILSNFENLYIYDTTSLPSETDGPEVGRLYKFHYSEYIEKLDEIKKLISKDSIASGSFDKKFSAIDEIPFEDTVDSTFLKKMNDWRMLISTDLYERGMIKDLKFINEVSQRMILRILFLRMCEDKGIESFKLLQEVAEKQNWEIFWNFLVTSDDRYNSGLFDTSPDFPIKEIGIGKDVLKSIIEDLYFPKAPFSFSVFQPELLGFVYERFLKDEIKEIDNALKLELKPGHVDRDVVPTPWPVINKITSRCFSKKLADINSSEDLFKLRVLDPASGSGSFLVFSYSLLYEKLVELLQQEKSPHVFENTYGINIDFSVKSKILEQTLYGIDRDFLAVEVTKFSLLTKLIELDDCNSLKKLKRILPNIDKNILHGDAVVESDVFRMLPNENLIGPPLDLNKLHQEKFDIIVGNPPYLNTESMKNAEPTEFKYYKEKYASAYKQFDKYYVFIERCLTELLKPNGILGMIVSRKFSHIGSGKKLRKILFEEASTLEMDDFGRIQIFSGKLVYPSILYVNKKSEKKDRFSFNYNLISDYDQWKYEEDKFSELGSSYIDKDKSWLLPSDDNEKQFLEAFFSNTIKLSECLEAFNGIQTSKNAVYVIKKATTIDHQYVYFKQLDKDKNEREWKVEKVITVPFFDGDIDTLRIFHPVKKTAFLIYPYSLEIEKGKDVARAITEEVFQKDYPEAYAYLSYWKDELSSRSMGDAVQGEESVWYRYGRTQALASFQNREKIIVGVNSLGDKYSMDNSGIFLASGNTAGECAISFYKNKKVPFEYDLNFILGLLGHKAVEFFCRKRGSVFQGGWYTRGTDVLNDIPLPLINNSNALRLYNSVTEKVKKLCQVYAECDIVRSLSEKNKLEAQAQSLKENINDEISELYGIKELVAKIGLPE